MSNRKENIKKSLGLTEYPWSSDDEDDPQINVESGTTAGRRQPTTSNLNSPRTTGQTDPLLSTCPRRRTRTRLERDLFWSLLNGPSRMSAPGAVPGSSRPSTSSSELNENVDLNDPVANLQRIYAIKRLSRSCNTNNTDTSSHCLHPVEGPSSSSWNPGSSSGSPSTQADTSSTSRTRKKKMYISPDDKHSAIRYRQLVLAERERKRNIMRPEVTFPMLIPVPRDSAIFNDGLETSSRSTVANRSNSNTTDQDQNGRGVLAEREIKRYIMRPFPMPIPVPRDSAIFNDGLETSSRSTVANRSNNNTTDQDQNGRGVSTSRTNVSIAVNTSDGRVSVGANTSEGRVEIAANISDGTVSVAANTTDHASLPEDVAEVDERGEENQSSDNISNRAQASEEEDGNEETADNSASVELVVSRGTKRKREGNDKDESCTLKDFNQSLLRLLECPVCMEWMEPPVTQCRRGHLVCGRCRSRLSACPVCRTAFSTVRNRAMEGVAEILRYPCQHGCGRESRLRRRAAHEASCAARRYQCPAPACEDREYHTLADLPRHFEMNHPSILKVGDRHQFSVKMNKEQREHWLVMAARELFHLRVDVDARAWGIVAHVAYIGPKCNAKGYTYEVSVIGQHNERKLVYTRMTHSDLESSSLNVSRQDCFHLTLDQALNFLRHKNRHCEPDKVLEFTVEIKKLDVPIATAGDDSDS